MGREINQDPGSWRGVGVSRTSPGPPAAVVLNAWLDGAAIFIVCSEVVEKIFWKG